MEVLNKQSTLLTNAEVFRIVKETRSAQNKKPKGERDRNLGTVLYEANQYLKDSPAAPQTNEQIMDVVAKLKPYKLTMAETLQIINLRPATTVEVQLIIEECEERIKTEEQLEALVQIVTESLPEKPAESEDGVEQPHQETES